MRISLSIPDNFLVTLGLASTSFGFYFYFKGSYARGLRELLAEPIWLRVSLFLLYNASYSANFSSTVIETFPEAPTDNNEFGLPLVAYAAF